MKSTAVAASPSCFSLHAVLGHCALLLLWRPLSSGMYARAQILAEARRMFQTLELQFYVSTLTTSRRQPFSFPPVLCRAISLSLSRAVAAYAVPVWTAARSRPPRGSSTRDSALGRRERGGEVRQTKPALRPRGMFDTRTSTQLEMSTACL